MDFEESLRSSLGSRMSGAASEEGSTTGRSRANSGNQLGEWEWITDEEELLQRAKQEQEKLFPTGLKIGSKIKICNLFIQISLLGGQAWESNEPEKTAKATYRPNKAFEAKGDSVQIKVCIPSISINSFDDEKSIWRVNVEVKRLMAEDHVQTSHHAKVLTFLRESSNLTSSLHDSPNISLILEKSNYQSSLTAPQQTYKVKVEVSPLRVYLDQDTLAFLCDFFTFTSDQQAVPPPAPKVKEQEDSILFGKQCLSDVENISNCLASIRSSITNREVLWVKCTVISDSGTTFGRSRRWS